MSERVGTMSQKAAVSVGMIGLGCAKNLVDGEVMLGHLRSAGAVVTSDPTEADVVVVNTCGFIVDAKAESINSILEVAEAKRRGEVKRLVVAGCMVQAFAEELRREIPEIDAFIGLDELENIVEAVRGEFGDRVPDQKGALRLYSHQQPRLVSTTGHAFLKVAEGCGNPCSFCTIPQMRGGFRSRAIDDLVIEAQRLESAGIRELVLIAQDTTRYGSDLGIKSGLLKLVQRLINETSVPWIRFLYAYPATLDMKLLELMAREKRFISYLDIPLQHASREVLQKMRRGGSASSHLKMLETARSIVPDITLRTTMIVGFPSEEETHFTELLDFVEEARFDHLGAFCYSWQEENPGSELGDPVPEEVKKIRRDALLELQQGISLSRNESFLGRRMPALVSGQLQEMELLTEARLERQAPEIDGRLLINDGTAPAGTLVEVEITEVHAYDLVARLESVIMQAPETHRAFLPSLPAL